ncbi:hypothetical protein C8R43DRAFT_979036 [Mycena crocata]|nr:hypothetical protein C8R43DRAFT_979036 [Mycena crocata]
MSSVLPDEIISEILSPALKIADDAFADTMQPTSPFAAYTRSTSAYLVVCKAWLRVATPLLYNVVVIRSKAQALALETALKSNKDLGMFIKKLRVEGGYGAPMKNILKYSPNITDLVLSLAIWSSDSVGGLCQGLSLIDPIRLIIHDTNFQGPGKNKQNLRLAEKLAERIRRWQNLRIVDLPYTYDWDPELVRYQQICTAITAAPFVEQVFIPIPEGFGLPEAIEATRHNPSFKSFTIKELLPPGWELGIEDPTLLEIVKHSFFPNTPDDGTAEVNIARPANPLFVPMESCSEEVQDKIWSRILYFALNAEYLDEQISVDVHTPGASPSVSPTFPSEMMLVSKRFERLTIQNTFRHVILQTFGDLAGFSASLLKHTGYAKDVRAVFADRDAALRYFDPYAFDPMNWRDEPDPATDELVRAMLAVLTGLVSLTGGHYDPTAFPPISQISDQTLPLNWDSFLTVGARAGRTLERFSLEVVPPPQIQSPIVLHPFVSLRALEWKSLVEFSLHPQIEWASGALDRLECLSLVEYHPTFLGALTTAELPSLRRVYFYEPLVPNDEDFLQRHGAKLTQLMIVNSDMGEIDVLQTCPTLPLLICSRNDRTVGYVPSVDLFTPTQPHLGLKKVILEDFGQIRREENEMVEFLTSIDPEKLPALHEIQVHMLHWPTNERDIQKCSWVVWAEMLLDKGIKMTDTSGKGWTPRLKASRR